MTGSMTLVDDLLKFLLAVLGPGLTTQRFPASIVPGSGAAHDAMGGGLEQFGQHEFLYERTIAALSVAFCRWSLPATNSEPALLRAIFALILGALAYGRKPYVIICALQLFSYAVPVIVPYCRRRLAASAGKGGSGKKKKQGRDKQSKQSGSYYLDLLLAPTLIAISGALSLLVCESFASGAAQSILRTVIPPSFLDLTNYLFPISELYRSYDLVSSFVDGDVLQGQLYHLLFVTFNIQVGMGYLGIGFLKAEQQRRNQLVRMEVLEADAEEEAAAGLTEREDEANKENSGGRSRNGSKGSGSEASKTTTTSASAALNGSQEGAAATSATSDKVREKQLTAARQFRRSAAPFIFLSVIPYMFQIIFFGNLNMFVATCVKDDVHRAVRVNELFGHDSHLVAMAQDSAMGPEGYATSMDTVVSTTYDIFNRKLFSLPKLMLLPGVIVKQPLLLVKIFPFIFVTDVIKARLVATITTTVEKLDKDAKEVKAIRSKVEAFDMKNAELLQRSGFGATEFTKRRWEELTVEYQNKKVASELLKRTRGFFQWLQRNFIFVALIDCALAQLIAVGRIVSAEIFVFSRAIEDTVDLLLMRSRAESELATMLTEIDKLQELANVWDSSKERGLLPCQVPSEDSSSSEGNKGIVMKNLLYSRGTALVRVDHMELPPGIYAVTGANGSGKSTLFRVLMSCASNEKSIDLPPSIVMESPAPEYIDKDMAPDDTCLVHDGCEVEVSEADGETDFADPAEVPVLSIEMPSSDVAEISQTFYWPLYTKPIDWIFQKHLSDCKKMERQDMVNRVADELMSLAFSQTIVEEQSPSDVDENGTRYDPVESKEDAIAAARAQLVADLQEEKEDWFSDLSGGQKSKVELVRKVFLHDACPKVLLIDETMAPLDPASKSLVMSRIKNFCSDSVVLVIYHTDVGRSVAGNGKEEVEVECVPSNDFFDDNIHVQNRMLTRRPVC